MDAEVKKEEEQRRVVDVTRPHLRKFFDCVDKPPGEVSGGLPWKPPVHGIRVKEKR